MALAVFYCRSSIFIAKQVTLLAVVVNPAEPCMSQPLLEFIEIGNPDADKSVIWLHGLGANGHDFEPIVPELDLPDGHNIRFLFPHAPEIPVTINAGMIMPAWYDVYSLSFTNHEDEQGIRDAAQRINQLIEHEQHRGIQTNKILLAGFSQGGAVALHAALRHCKPLAGVMALSTYLPLVKQFDAERHVANQAIPILMCHGAHDPVVPFQLGDDSRYFLEQAGYQVDWHTYPMQHGVCPDEIHDISQWLQKTLL